MYMTKQLKRQNASKKSEILGSIFCFSLTSYAKLIVITL